jgi:hypothetical protein
MRIILNIELKNRQDPFDKLLDMMSCSDIRPSTLKGPMAPIE